MFGREIPLFCSDLVSKVNLPLGILLIGGPHNCERVNFPDLPLGGTIRMARLSDVSICLGLPMKSFFEYDEYRVVSRTQAVFIKDFIKDFSEKPDFRPKTAPSTLQTEVPDDLG